MRCTRMLRWVLLLAGLLVGLVACEGRPDPKKNPIDAETVRSTLPGQTLTGLDGGDLTIDGPVYVELSEVTYAGREGEARFLLRTVSPGSKKGVEGELRARYEFRGGAWKLLELTALSAKGMYPAYAERLTELAGFPLHLAANIGDREGVTRELDNGAPVNAPEGKKGSTAVMFASERGFLPIVELLIARGADVSLPNKLGYTALHAATSGAHLEVAKTLIAHGADVHAADDRGRTPLFFAAEKNAPELARLLKEHGADLDARDRKGWTPLYAAVETGALEAAGYLIEQGAMVKSRAAGDSRSPLLMASFAGNVEMVRLLLEAGADVTAQMSMGHSPYRGMTALQIAEKQGHTEIVELLKGAGAH